MELITENKLIVSLLLFLCLISIKHVVCRFVKRRYKRKGLDKRYLVNNVRNIINLILFVLLIALWSSELQHFALSIAAFIVAIVLATKEIIQCIIGFVYISSSHPFRIGDWIQVNEFTGEVSETDWAKVTLLEVDLSTYSYTGRSVFIPNSQFMVQPIKNLNYMRRYVNHSFHIIRDDDHGIPVNLVEQLYENSTLYCAGFSDVAERYNTLIQNRLDITIPGPEPTVKISTTDIGKIKVSFELFCPTKEAIAIEQKLIADLFNLWRDKTV